MIKRKTVPTTPSYDDRTIGPRIRRVRTYRGMTQQAVADLAGISKATLCRIETGIAALDRHSWLFALADALRIAPSDLMALPIPAPANGNTDGSIEAVRRALMAVTTGRPGGDVQPVEQLRHRHQQIVDKNRQAHGDFANHGAVLPSLIVDLHTTLAQRQEMNELLPLAVMIHGGPVGNFLSTACASVDLCWQNVMLARTLAQELDDPILLAYITANIATRTMIQNGEFDLASVELDATSVSTATDDGRQVDGILALNRSLVATGQGRAAESAAVLDHADELAAHIIGDPFTTELGQDCGFSPVCVDLWRMFTTLESGNSDDAIRIAGTMNPQENPFVSFQAAYWTYCARALTQVRRRDDAARAMLTAEKLHPVRVLRGAFARETLMQLLTHAKDDRLGREIRRMAYDARLHLKGEPGVSFT